MSGGVDSSVTATLLKKQGFDVTGIFIRVWEPPNFPCTWREDRRDAMRVAAQLGVPMKTIDLSAEYKKEVVDYMIEEYKNGLTPNPDVMCNKEIKFGAFYNWAKQAGADFVATGHYAKTENGKLFKGIDESKDQSYFLWTVNKEILQNTIFPLGDLSKTEVRKQAKKFNLPTAYKKDSQGLCFIGKIDIKDFLKDYIPPQNGRVLNEQGEVIGSHEGTFFYTLGQRHGFTVKNKGEHHKPLYVIAKDMENNTITVGKEQQQNEVTEISLRNTNWIDGEPDPETEYTARFRHLGKLFSCKFNHRENKVVFDKPIKDVAQGQSLVLYKDRELLGGGIIV